jgi:ATP-dependent DNA helicase RecG
MRPDILFPLFRPVTSLKGVGPRIGKLIEKAAGPKLLDLVWHLPTGIVDRRYRPKVAEVQEGVIATLTLDVAQHQPPPTRRLPYRVICQDETGFITLVFFHAHTDYLAKVLPEGERRVVSGTVQMFQGTPQIVHPDHIVTLAEAASLPQVEPVYPLTQGLTPRPLLRAVHDALDAMPELPEWLDPAWRERQGWQDWRQSLMAAHAPEGAADLEPTTRARQRLAYDELLANKLALALVRRSMRRRKGRPIVGDGRLVEALKRVLPYRLTAAQERSIDEILADLAEPVRMLRLLQGDVGSGKTVVALIAMLVAVEAGAQAALMAPTEILARQHLETIRPLAEGLGLEVALLTGRDKGKAREATLARIAEGAADIVIGTHALFQSEVAFRDLSLAVIDEQHRFGVHQRLNLSAKGDAVDVLVMTATPIPRTLTMTVYGDMETSRLDEKPAGRGAVDTRTVPLARLAEVVAGVGRAVGDGARAFWVCPLVEESEALDVAAAEERYASLKGTFGDRVGLVHGRIKGAERDRVMNAFRDGDLDLLVATTVIEVGVDVAEATVMVVEHAERFGLAQLHQLRGRIGRGETASTCLLLYGEPLTEAARARLRILRESEDGFLIAEEDLRLRGAGEVLGTRQSGLPSFRIADLQAHRDLMLAARDDARLVMEIDPELSGPRGQALRCLLYLFERDAAIQYLRSG